MITYRQANSDDNSGLLKLAAETGMAGDIGLRIDRNPDFFSLLEMRGDSKVFVAEDRNIIVGAICVSRQHVYIDGKIYPLQYIGDFRVSAQYRNRGIGLGLCNAMADYVISENSDLAFLNVSKGNKKPVSFFKGRPGVPDFDNIGIFKIYQIIGKKINTKYSPYKIEETMLTDEVLDFFNCTYSKYQLGAVLTKEKFEGTRIFMVKNREAIIATMALIDTMPFKQNVITMLSWKLNLVLKLINVYGSLAGFSRMPGLNEPVKMLYIKYLAADISLKQVIRSLINHARRIAYENDYAFVSLGLHEKDSLNECLNGLPKLTFKSVGMLLSIKDNRHLITKIKEGIPFEDYSLV
jgi:hypothetical protein